MKTNASIPQQTNVHTTWSYSDVVQNPLLNANIEVPFPTNTNNIPKFKEGDKNL